LDFESPQKTKGERALLLSLWAIIFLTFGIWKFWPGEAHIDTLDDPKLVVAGELSAMFESVRLQSKTPTNYQAEVTLKKSFLNSYRSSGTPFRIGYDLDKGGSVHWRGVTRLTPGDEPQSIVSLSNPERISATQIRFYLAR
jgi:hypothetical protein